MNFLDTPDEAKKSLVQQPHDPSGTWESMDLGLPDAHPFLSYETDFSIDSSSLDWLIDPFEPICLGQLNAKADMLRRLDNKYIIRNKVLHDALDDLTAHFDILEIDGKRVFTYDTCYFDDAKNSSYFDHLRGRRQRFKVRTRKYNDAQMCFVEMKLKDKRGVTIKKRLNYLIEKYGTLDDGAWNHIVSSYRELYRREFAYLLTPVLEMRYKRISLVAKEGGERMTIDHNLVFAGNGRLCSVDDNVFIVETKSSNANGIADKILRSFHQHPIKSCSKYCVARAALNGVERRNRFLPALRKLNITPNRSLENFPPAASVSAYSHSYPAKRSAA